MLNPVTPVPPNTGATEQPDHEATDVGPNYADDYGDDDAAGVVTRHDELRQRTAMSPTMSQVQMPITASFGP